MHAQIICIYFITITTIFVFWCFCHFRYYYPIIRCWGQTGEGENGIDKLNNTAVVVYLLLLSYPVFILPLQTALNSSFIEQCLSFYQFPPMPALLLAVFPAVCEGHAQVLPGDVWATGGQTGWLLRRRHQLGSSADLLKPAAAGETVLLRPGHRGKPTTVKPLERGRLETELMSACEKIRQVICAITTGLLNKCIQNSGQRKFCKGSFNKMSDLMRNCFWTTNWNTF